VMDRSGHKKIEEAGISSATWKSRRFYAGFARQADVAYHNFADRQLQFIIRGWNQTVYHP